MSPLVQPPNRGYADWQRVENFDSGVIWSQPPNLQNTLIQSPVLDVSRYQYLGGLMGEAVSIAAVDLLWYDDSGATIPVGYQNFVLSSQIGTSAQLRLPNLGPFLVVRSNSVGAINYEYNATLIATNRPHALQIPAVNPLLIDQQGTALGANSTATLYPLSYYAGPISIFSSCPQSTTVVLAALSFANTWDEMYATPTIAANANNSCITVVPPGAWRVGVVNGSAVATTFNLVIVPSYTGST